MESLVSASIRVLAAPYVTLSDSAITLMPNDNLTLWCEAWIPDTGHPGCYIRPNFTWYQNGNPLQGDCEYSSFLIVLVFIQ